MERKDKPEIGFLPRSPRMDISYTSPRPTAAIYADNKTVQQWTPPAGDQTRAENRR